MVEKDVGGRLLDNQTLTCDVAVQPRPPPPWGENAADTACQYLSMHGVQTRLKAGKFLFSVLFSVGCWEIPGLWSVTVHKESSACQYGVFAARTALEFWPQAGGFISILLIVTLLTFFSYIIEEFC